MTNFKEEYKKETKRNPHVFDRNGMITSNFSYTDDYVYWLERKLEKNKF